MIAGELYSNIPGKNEETLAMISVYRFGESRAKREALREIEKDYYMTDMTFQKLEITEVEELLKSILK